VAESWAMDVHDPHSPHQPLSMTLMILANCKRVTSCYQSFSWWLKMKAVS